MDDSSSPPDSLFFAAAARKLCAEARRMGLRPPVFAAPPREGLNRSIRRRCDGDTTVRVRLKGRSRCQVVEDMVDGIVAANNLPDPDACDKRQRLLAAV